MFSVIKYCTQYTTILYCTCVHIILSPTLVFRPHLCQIVNMQLHLSYNPLGSQKPPDATLERINVKMFFA